MAKPRLGEILIRKGHISRDHLRIALEIQSYGDKEYSINPGELLGKILVKRGFVETMTLVRILCEQKDNVDFLPSGKYLVEPRVLTWITEEVATRYAVMPLVSLGDEILLVSSNSDLTPDELEVLSGLVKRKVDVLLFEDPDVYSSIKRCYSTFQQRGVSSARIGEVLVRDGYVSDEDMEEALYMSRKTQRMVGKVLIETGKVNEVDFFKMLSTQRRIPLIAQQDLLPMLDKELALKLSKAFCIHNSTVPYLREGDTIFVVTAEPTIDSEDLKAALGCTHVHINLTTYSDIALILRHIFVDEASSGLQHDEEDQEDEEGADDFLEDVAITEGFEGEIESIEVTTKKYQKITNALLVQAIKAGASDIHLETYDKDVFIRYRVDGTLYDNNDIRITKKNINGVVNVIKISSDINIAERRLPQAGRFRRRMGDMTFDFRVQTQPTLHGENVVIRLLKQSANTMLLEKLGFMPDIEARFSKVIQNPSGMILIVGPTGSGKTTTLYSTLGLISKDVTKKVLTIEDPIEYSVTRLQQSQVKKEIGFGFPDAIRAFLREDPDVILVGEIRDRETAMEALRASQTGHLVFSTLHVSNTVETIQRLMDLDLVSGTIAAEMVSILAQRLAKRNCPHCLAPHKPSKELLDSFYPNGVPSHVEFKKGMGCEKCNFMGHKGRIAVFELWLVDVESKKLIIQNAPFDELYDSATNHGLIPMIKDALYKVENGIIALDELPNIIPYFQVVRWKYDKANELAAEIKAKAAERRRTRKPAKKTQKDETATTVMKSRKTTSKKSKAADEPTIEVDIETESAAD